MSETIPEATYNEAWQIAGQCVERPYNQGTMRKAAARIARAILAEREACAKVADDYGGGDYWGAAKPIASAIRDRREIDR